MRVFMLGWEFPPYISGGLGTACYGLTKALDQLGIKVTFVLPMAINTNCATHVRLLSAFSSGQQSSFESAGLKNVEFRIVNSPLRPYVAPNSHGLQPGRSRQEQATQGNLTMDFADEANYAGDMRSEVFRYTERILRLAANEDFDIIHAHDWMTYLAGVAVAQASAKPLVVHVHSTEFDRSGEHVNQMIYDIERRGMECADKVITVSKLTRNTVVNRYGISPDKVEVVYNGIERNRRYPWSGEDSTISDDEKIVLYLGRITMQKGPEYFLEAAKKVLDVMDNVKFIMAGSGDLMHRAVEKAAELGIGSKVVFTGFLRGDDVRRIYEMADLFVMPSVSEPFGLVPLEALDNDVPVIISKQSGVSEVLRHALKVNFWDVNEMANKIIAVLRYPALKETLRNYGNFEVRKLRWKEAADKCVRIYEELLVVV